MQGSVLNMSAQASPNDRQPIANFSLHNLRPNGMVFSEEIIFGVFSQFHFRYISACVFS